MTFQEALRANTDHLVKVNGEEYWYEIDELRNLSTYPKKLVHGEWVSVYKPKEFWIGIKKGASLGTDYHIYPVQPAKSENKYFAKIIKVREILED